MLPPGQKVRSDFPRFGLPQYAARFPSNTTSQLIEIRLNGSYKKQIDLSTTEISRCTKEADFHCVTTWSYLGAKWSGINFSDLVKHLFNDIEIGNLSGVVLYAQDGYKTSLILEDLLVEGAMLADTLDGSQLTVEHGAPIRLIAPNHYGYKNIKHLSGIEFYSKLPVIKRGLKGFMDHPRARVSEEERGRWIPGWILRYVYRLMIASTVKDFSDSMQQYRNTIK